MLEHVFTAAGIERGMVKKSVNMAEEPLVSIVIPCYNHEKYIEECLKSLIGQSYKNIEILLIDDCSLDESVAKIETWIGALEERFTRVLFIRNKENLGVVKSINTMIGHSNGKYVKLLASDDMLFPGAIKDLVAYLEMHETYGAVYSNHIICGADDKYDVKCLQKKEVKKSPAPLPDMPQALYEDDFIIVPTTLIRKGVYDKVGLHDENLQIEDWEFWIRTSFSFPIGYLDGTTAIYRVVQNSLSRFDSSEAGIRRLKVMIENEIKVLDKFKDYPQINSKPGIRKCCEQGISLAVDLEADEVVMYICDYLKRNQVRLGCKMEIKYILYRLKIGKWVKALQEFTKDRLFLHKYE